VSSDKDLSVTARSQIPSPLDLSPFTSASGRAAGIPRGRLRSLDVSHPFQGVHHIGEIETLIGRCAALATKLPEYAFFCGPTAAALLDVPLPREIASDKRVHVGVPAGNRTLVGRGVKGHTYELVETQAFGNQGLRISHPARLWCELGPVLAVPDLVVAGDFLIHWRHPLTDLAHLQHAVKVNPDPRGRRALRAALGRLNERSESPQESRLRLLLVSARIHGWTANLPITTSDGYHYRADFGFPNRKFILEYQSYLHEGPEKFRADMTRISRLQADDWQAMLINADDMRNHVELAARIERTLASRPYF
jgi:hypothetical protein